MPWTGATKRAGSTSRSTIDGLQWPVLSGARERWEGYVTQVERNIVGVPTTSPPSNIFGSCVRCGSQRLVVTTKQLRCADEGMTIPRCPLTDPLLSPWRRVIRIASCARARTVVTVAVPMPESKYHGRVW